MLDWSLWCGRHLEPYRAQWPLGAPSAMIMLFQAAAEMPAVVVDAAHGNTDELEAALNRFKPICCFIPKAKLDEIYAKTVPVDTEPER